MKKNVLFSSLMVFAFSAYAQTDITPARYKIENQPVGQYVIDHYNGGWGPDVAAAQAKWDEGAVVLTGGDMFASSEAEDSKYFQSGLSIIDLTAENVGKVLCLKGDLCDDAIFPYGTKCQGIRTAQWPMLSFISDVTNTPYGKDPITTIRVRVVYKGMENEPDDSKPIMTGGHIKTKTNNSKGQIAGANSFEMTIKDINTEEEYLLNEGWIATEVDFNVPEEAGAPFSASVSFDGLKVASGVILIKEIKFTTNPVGEPVLKSTITLAAPPSGLETESVSKVLCMANGNVLSVSNLTPGAVVEVFSAMGTQLASFNAQSTNETVRLSGQGFYIVKVDGKSYKVLNK